MPVPDLAVGRLVKTPAEITATVDHFLGLDAAARCPTPDVSPGHRLRLPRRRRRRGSTRSSPRPCRRAASDTLIAAVRHAARRVVDRRRPASESCSASRPRPGLPGRPLQRQRHPGRRLRHHARRRGAAPGRRRTRLPTRERRQAHRHPGAERRLPLRLQHRRRRGRARPTNRYDWTQRMAQQQAVLIGGTGYQYGDTDFLEYSERLYLDVARRLREGPGRRRRAPVAVGEALTAGQAGLPGEPGHADRASTRRRCCRPRCTACR